MNAGRIVTLLGGVCMASMMLAWGPGRAPAESAATIDTKESDWDVFVDNQKAGRVHLKTMAVRDLVIIEENFSVTIKGKETSFANQIVYKTGNPPRPVRGKAETRQGALKLMKGTALFSEASVKAEISGFTDKDLKPLATPLTETKETPLPPGLVLTYPALMYFAPKLMPETGQMPRVAYLEFPSGVAFPEFAFAVPECVLTRGPVRSDGRIEFALKHVFSGGNAQDLVAMTVDKTGDITEVRLRPFSLRPASAAPAPAAAPKAGKK